MRFFYSKSQRNFYIDVFVGEENIPADAQEISERHYNELIYGQCLGKRVVPCDERVAKLVEYEPSAEDIAAAVDAARQAAYTTEADPLFFKAQRGAASLEDWRAKVDEIKARYPDSQLPG